APAVAGAGERGEQMQPPRRVVTGGPDRAEPQTDDRPRYVAAGPGRALLVWVSLPARVEERQAPGGGPGRAAATSIRLPAGRPRRPRHAAAPLAAGADQLAEGVCVPARGERPGPVVRFPQRGRV